MKSGAHTGASQTILSYLRQNPNVHIPYKDIEKATGLPAFTVSNSISHLIARGVNVERPMKGVAMFKGGPKAPPPIPEQPFLTVKLYEYVGISGGTIVVRDEEEELYRLEPLFGRQ